MGGKTLRTLQTHSRFFFESHSTDYPSSFPSPFSFFHSMKHDHGPPFEPPNLIVCVCMDAKKQGREGKGREGGTVLAPLTE